MAVWHMAGKTKNCNLKRDLCKTAKQILAAHTSNLFTSRTGSAWNIFVWHCSSAPSVHKPLSEFYQHFEILTFILLRFIQRPRGHNVRNRPITGAEGSYKNNWMPYCFHPKLFYYKFYYRFSYILLSGSGGCNYCICSDPSP